MTADDKALEIAARIADGSAIDWPATADAADDVLDELKTIAALATLHRSPLDALIDPETDVRRWGPLTILDPIGEGRFGQVFRAWDARLHRQVALKVLHTPAPEATASPLHAIDEARLLARVRHPNVLTIYGAEALDGRVGIWTEFIEGRTLEQVLAERGPLPPDEVAAIGVDLCRALTAVHDAGLLHRDIKAQNVMRETGGRIVLMDFGTGHDLDVVAPRAGDMSGTPLYLAPEIFAGGAATAASDVYALAVLLFRLLTGEYPVPGKTLDDVRSGHQQRIAARLRHTRADLSPRLVEAIERGLARDPAQRHKTASAFEAALVPSRRPGRWLVAALVAVTALAAGTWSLSNVPSPERSTETTTREITLPDGADGIGSLSADARLIGLSTVTGQVTVLDTRTGNARVVVEPTGTARAVGGVVFRPGDRSMVFGWREAACKCIRLREVGIDGGEARTVLPDMAFDLVEPHGFSRDGARLLVRATPENHQDQLAIVDMAAATYKPLFNSPLNMQSAALSPDGRFIAYDRSSETTDLGGNIFVTPVDSGETLALATGPADETAPMWTPDGGAVLFVSDATGTRGLWQVEFRDGRPAGDPQVLQRDMGLFIPLWVSAGGTLLFWRTPILDVETAPFDSVTGMVTGEPRKLPVRIAGSNSSPDWSPDGSAIVYASERKVAGPARSRIVIHDVNAGTERELAVPINGPLEPRWSPSPGSQALLVRGPGARDGVRGARSIDATTGTVTRVFPFPGPSPGLCCLLWSQDGLHFYFAGNGGIHRVDARTGEKIPIPVADGWQTGVMALSPDGSLIAAAAGAGERSALLLIPAAGGMPRILATKQDRPLPLIWDWTPDGNRLIGVRRVPGQPPGTMELVTVSVADGTISAAGLRREGLARVTVRPDGRELVYGAGRNHRTLWVLEHFLPVRR